MGRKKLVLGSFAFFAKLRPASGEPSLGLGAPFWAPGGVFTVRGLEKRKKPKNFESEAKVQLLDASGKAADLRSVLLDRGTTVLYGKKKSSRIIPEKFG